MVLEKSNREKIVSGISIEKAQPNHVRVAVKNIQVSPVREFDTNTNSAEITVVDQRAQSYYS